MVLRRLVLLYLLAFLSGCGSFWFSEANSIAGRFTIGVVSYGEGTQSIERYQAFVDYLASQLKMQVELEPAYNEVQALMQIRRQAWALVFAPSGLSAIATSEFGYLPLFPLAGVTNQQAVIVVLDQSDLQQLRDLAAKRIALGQPGSVTSYYLPLYDLYGLTLAAVTLTATPKEILAKVVEGTVDAGALSKAEFDRFRLDFPPKTFRILHISRRVPAGAVLISPQLSSPMRQQIEQAMTQAIPALAAAAGYIPNAQPPNYDVLRSFIEKVKPIEPQLRRQPVALFLE